MVKKAEAKEKKAEKTAPKKAVKPAAGKGPAPKKTAPKKAVVVTTVAAHEKAEPKKKAAVKFFQKS